MIVADRSEDTLSDSEFVKVLDAMRRACAGREYCAADILKKLQRYKLAGSDNTKVIASLKEDKFIDELRYAKAFVADKSRLSGWGRTKIIWALKSKQINKEIIEKAVSILSADDAREQLRKILTGKLKTLPFNYGSSGLSDSYSGVEEFSAAECRKIREKQRAKLIRFGLSRGFEYDMVLSVVNELLQN